ncbi:MAG: hypothetical protein AAGB26_16500 [Planctomycetota bacterium]
MNLHGEERLAVLLYPDLVQSYRTDKVYDRETSEKDYAVITQGPDLSQAQIDHLRRLYIDLRGYDTLRRIELERYFPFEGFRAWGRGCEWKPDVVYEYWRDGKGVRVVICFGCSMWAFESGGKRYGVFGFAEDQRASGLQPMIRETTIEVFPEMMNSIPKHRH